MCNGAACHISLDLMRGDLRQLKIPLVVLEGCLIWSRCCISALLTTVSVCASYKLKMMQ